MSRIPKKNRKPKKCGQKVADRSFLYTIILITVQKCALFDSCNNSDRWTCMYNFLCLLPIGKRGFKTLCQRSVSMKAQITKLLLSCYHCKLIKFVFEHPSFLESLQCSMVYFQQSRQIIPENLIVIVLLPWKLLRKLSYYLLISKTIPKLCNTTYAKTKSYMLKKLFWSGEYIALEYTQLLLISIK